MTKPAAPGLHVRKWSNGRWTDSPDAVVTEEPLQLMLEGKPLSVVMRTPGHDLELCLGLLYSEGILRTLDDVTFMRISAEAGESENGIRVAADLVESNQVDVHFTKGPRRRPERSMLSSSACGVCGTVLIEDLRRDLAPLPDGPVVDPSVLPGLVEILRQGQGVFDRTGGLHAAGVFSATGKMHCVREDVGRHNAIDKAVGAVMRGGKEPQTLLVTSRASYEVVHKAAEVGCTLVAAISAPTSLALRLAQEAGVTLVGWTREPRLTVYCGALGRTVTDLK